MQPTRASDDDNSQDCRPGAHERASGSGDHVMSLRNRIEQWPLFRQLTSGGDGTGPEAMSDATRALGPRHQPAQVARSVCPYCAVGCGQLVFHRDGEVVSIEGDPESPISRGRLCPKGAASYELLTHPARADESEVPRAARQRVDRDSISKTAMEMVADRVWESASARSTRGVTMRRAADHAVRVNRAPRRRHARQRRELPDQEALHRRPGDGLHQQPGPDMT